MPHIGDAPAEVEIRLGMRDHDHGADFVEQRDQRAK
jgi:hypothetical protein